MLGPEGRRLFRDFRAENLLLGRSGAQRGRNGQESRFLLRELRCWLSAAPLAGSMSGGEQQMLA